MLAEYLKQNFKNKLREMDVLELDAGSPLTPILSGAKRYTRTFYSRDVRRGATNEQGARCEDITALSFGESEIDLIISSDVLEHVPALPRAFDETFRVLKPNGIHVFTVPFSENTRPRAVIQGGTVKHILPPEYHLDPLNPEGILAFWDIGKDLADWGKRCGLHIGIVKGPEGPENRVVWAAAKRGEPTT
jgi:SAM-dependent methyltransferase